MKLHASIASFAFFAGAIAVFGSGSGCSSKTSDSSFAGSDGGGDGSSGGSGGFSDDGGVLSVGDSCGGADGTSLTGTVYDPGGNNPLYNVVVYLPTTDVKPFTDTAVTCDTCTSLYTGAPSHSTLTDAKGNFKFTNIKGGSNIKVVAQVGKFRKIITVPTVTSCSPNAIPDKTIRLPKNSSEGDLPNIAISTGGSDTLECLLSRMGIDSSEFTGGPGGTGHIHIFQGNAAAGAAPNTQPPGPFSPDALWDTSAHLKAFDMVLLSCEGAETTGMNQQNLYDYANAGGRIFASHFHYSWFDQPPFSQGNLANWTPGVQVLSSGASVDSTIQTNFPKGQAMHDWLGNVGALNAAGNLPITYACANAAVTSANPASTPWIQIGTATEYLSFNTPLGGNTEAQCGRAVFSDLHVGSAKHDDPTAPVPTGCEASALSGQEKALEFMLFDLAGCVIPDTEVPQPPVQ